MKIKSSLGVLVCLLILISCDNAKIEPDARLNTPIQNLESQFNLLKKDFSETRRKVANEDLEVQANTEKEKKKKKEIRKYLYQADKNILKTRAVQLEKRVAFLKENSIRNKEKETEESADFLLEQIHDFQKNFKPAY